MATGKRRGGGASSDVLSDWAGADGLTRRGFLGTAIAIPIATQAAHLGEQDLLQPEDVDLDISNVDGLLKIGIQRGVAPERKRFWARLGVHDIAWPETEETGPVPDGSAWSIETARFGPETKVRLRNATGPGGRRRYVLALHDISFGRVADRRMRFHLEERSEPDIEGIGLLGRLRAMPDGHGEVIGKRIREARVEDVPPLRVYTIRVTTNLWSLRRRPTATQWFELSPPEGSDPAALVEGYLRLSRWTRAPGQGAPQRVELQVDAGRLTSTLKLVFNGQVGYADRDANRDVRLSFDQVGVWRMAQETAQLEAMAEGLGLRDFSLRWQPVGADARDAVETDAEGDRTGPPAAADAFEMVGRGTVAKPDGPITIAARRGVPGMALQLAPSTEPREVRFRVLDPTEIEDGKFAPGMVRSEAALLADWSRLTLTGGAEAGAGPFIGLRGRLLERVDAPAAMDDFDYAECFGNIGFGADFTGPASRHWRVDTPVGPMGFRGPSVEEDGEEADTEDDPFRPRRGDQVQAVWTWGRTPRGFEARRRPRADWIELNGVLREATVRLEGADFNRLRFDTTHLTFLYTPDDLPPPLTSYVRLCPPKSVTEVAQLDLSDAALTASRTEDLLGLTFRFADFALSLQRGRTELVRRNAACRITTDRGPEGGHAVRDGRPVLVVEFPGQHLFEEAFFAPKMQELPDVVIEKKRAPDDEAVAAYVVMRVGRDGANPVFAPSDKRVTLKVDEEGTGWVLDPNDRQQVVEMLRATPDVKDRVALRKAIRDEKKSQAGADAFIGLADAYGTRAAGVTGLPEDQHVYVGPYALDPDAMRLARKIWAQRLDAALAKQAEDLRNAVKEAAVKLHAEAVKLKNRSAEMDRIARALETFDGALALEQRLEAQFPSYQLFRSVYRDLQLGAAMPADGGTLETLRVERLEAVHVDLLTGFDKVPLWMKNAGLSAADLVAARDAAGKAYVKALKEREAFHKPARARIANPSRLAFRVNCRDGITVARNRVETLDTTGDEKAREIRRELEFTLADLTRFHDFDLSVVRRAEAIYRPSETGRIDGGSRRRLDLSQGARLDHLGFSHGPFVSADTRLGEIAASLRDPPGLRETAIEIPARLTLSPDQNAVVVAHTGQVPRCIYTAGQDDRGNWLSVCAPDAPEVAASERAARLWSTEFLVREVDPNLRAVHSPDLRPDVFFARSRDRLLGEDVAGGKVAGMRLPGAGAPPRGPLAPWHLGADWTQTAAMGPGNVKDFADDAPALARLIAWFRGEEKRLGGIDPADLQFRAAIDAYARHEIVLLSSAWGLPVLGRRSTSGQIMADASQSEAAQRHRLFDVTEGSALYEPQTLKTIELALTPLGGTLRHASSFEPFAGAFDIRGEALFDAVSVESWQQWTNLGRDVHCEIVYKGFLWPIGMRAALVQVTEREFFIDPTGAIRAVLRQRLFIRVGKAEKLFPALKQPAQGRRFPVERLTNLTTQTPDIVDPSGDAVPEIAAGMGPVVLPSGRVALTQGTKGLVFWPRTARLAAANIRFELDIDGTLTDMPLIFVDNVAANDATTLRKLSRYYNDIGTPDPADHKKEQEDFDPLVHLRTLDMGGGKRRYAAEKEVGSASIETWLWSLCATGLTTQGGGRKPEQNIEVWRRVEDTFESDPLLQGADQPPFYPALDVARIRVRQAERLIGGPLVETDGPKTRDPRYLRAMPDGHFVEYGLPAASGTDAAVQQAVRGNVAETYLAMIDQLHLGMGTKGDQSGGVYRPSGVVVGLSRLRGVLTWNSKLLPNVETTLDCANLLSVAPAFEVAVDTAPGQQPGMPTAGKTEGQKALCTTAETVTIDPAVEATLADVRELYENVVDGEAKILGLVSIKDLFQYIEKLDPPSTGMPDLAEQAQYGAKEVQSAIGQVDAAVGDGLAALDETVDLVRVTVVVPLSEAVHDIREGWDELDRDIATYTDKVPAGLVGDISFATIFPDLHCTLTAFDAALARSVAAADALAFSLAVSEVFAAGRRFLDALFRAAADPGRRVEAGLTQGIGGLLELVTSLQKGQFELLARLAIEFLAEKRDYARLLKIVQFVASGGPVPNAEIRGYAEKLAELLVPEGEGERLAIFTIPPQPVDLGDADWQLVLEALQPRAGVLRAIVADMLVEFVTAKGEITLDELLERAGAFRALHAEAMAGLARAKALALNAAAGMLGEYEAFLTQLDPGQALFNITAETRARNARNLERLKQWLLAGWAEEWRLLRQTEAGVRAVIAAVEAQSIERTITELRNLAALHFGPLTEFDESCARVLVPLGTVATAIRPAPDGLHQKAIAKIDAMAGRVTELQKAVGDADEELEEIADTLKTDVKKAVDDLGDDTADDAYLLAQRKLAEVREAISDATTLLTGLQSALTATRDDIEVDRMQVVWLSQRLAALTTGTCDANTLKQLEGLHRDMLALIEFRRAAMTRFAMNVKTVADAAEQVLNNPVTQVAGGLAALGVVVAQLSDLAGLPGLSGVKTTLDEQQSKAEALRNSLKARADAYAKAFGEFLVTVAQEMSALLTQLQEGLETSNGAKAVRDLLGPEIVGKIDTALDDLKRHREWLDAVAVQIEEAIQTDAAENLASLKIDLPDQPAFGAIDFFTGSQGIALQVVTAIEERLTAELAALGDQAAVILRRVSGSVVEEVNAALVKVLQADAGLPLPSSDGTPAPGEANLVAIYRTLLEQRNTLYDLQPLESLGLRSTLLARPDGRGATQGFTPAGANDPLDTANDRLAGDVAWLGNLAAGTVKLKADKGDPSWAFISVFLEEWRNGRPTPVEISRRAAELIGDILKGDLFAAIDFTDLRRMVEDYILSLVPTRIEMNYGYGVELGENVRSATAGIFGPGPGSKLTIEAGIVIDLAFDNASVNAKTVGRLGAFDVKLVGDAFDALTLKFNGAVFTAETGKKMDFDISYSDYEIGPMLEFVQQFAQYLSPKGKNGFILEPKFNPLGVEAGYILNLGDFTVGTMAISNVGLATSAILPFEDSDARFRASLSTRMSPFTITYAPYGGSGFFAIEANANGILGFEASFEFGGSAVFAFGPLTGKGRLMAGFYIRQSVGDNGQKLTELSATFFVGGTAQIWIFSFAASLSVRLGMVNGNMSGEAIFSFSFSMGLADFEYSVTVFKKEGKGFQGQEEARLRDMPFGQAGLRFADLSLTPEGLQALKDNVPRIDTDTACQTRSWAKYSRYFTDEPAEDIFL